MIFAVILAYNEEAALPGLLRALEERLAGEPHRFLVVDDGSRDGTAAAARQAARSLPVTLLGHPVNQGVGRAFDTGLRRACAEASDDDIVVTLEGDMTNDPACVPSMIERLRQGCDVVCASRYARGGAYVGFPLKRRILSLGANLAARWIIGIPGVKDYTLFCRAYRAEVLKRALARCGPRFIERRGFCANCEILLKVQRAGPVRCGEVPMVYRYDLKRGASSMKVLANLAEYWRLFRSA